MNFPDGWAWQPGLCPADQDFIEWIGLKSTFGYSILHMGTGLHHRVGNFLSGNNDVMGITYSPEEMTAYIKRIKQVPLITSHYTVIFGDIYNLDYYLLPKFHFITLFHLGEIYDPEYTARDSTQVIEELQEYLYDGGNIIYYKDSAAVSTVLPLLDDSLVRVEEYKSLIVYKKKE